MGNDTSRSIKIVTWKEVRKIFIDLNKELTNIIDEIDPNDEYKFIEVEYLYGDTVVKNGIINLPSRIGELFCKNDAIHHDTAILDELSYSDMPVFLVAQNDCELVVETKDEVIPLNLMHAGWINGTYELMDMMCGIQPRYNWRFFAGSRTIITLPKITNVFNLKKLSAEFNLSPYSSTVKDFSDHWSLFKALAQSENFPQTWKLKIFYFGIEWFKLKTNSSVFRKFKDYWVNLAWLQAQIPINRMNFSLQWRKYSEAITRRKLKPTPYILEQLKHIIAISSGMFPAFKVIDDSQQSAPTESFKKILVDTYSLQNYLPTMMHVAPIADLTKYGSLYYSLIFPTILEGTTFKRNSSTIIEDLRSLKFLIDTLYSHTRDLDNITNCIIHNCKFNYFHIENDFSNEITPSCEIPSLDSSFAHDAELFPNREVCTNSQFFRGCIKITPNFVFESKGDK